MKEFSYGIIPFIFTDKGVEILMYKSSNKTSKYAFFKGKPEKFETIKETVKREIKEEIGIKIQKKELYNSEYRYHVSTRKNIGLFFFSFEKYKDKQLILAQKEIFETKWFPIDNLPEVCTNQIEFLLDIKERFNKIHMLLLSK